MNSNITLWLWEAEGCGKQNTEGMRCHNGRHEIDRISKIGLVLVWSIHNPYHSILPKIWVLSSEAKASLSVFPDSNTF